MIKLILNIPLIILAADFISGLFHWWEDTYGNPNWKYLGEWVVKPNLVHHKEPRSFIKNSYWKRNNTTIITSMLFVVVPFLLFNYFSWVYCMVFLFASQGNEIHKFAHQSDKENGKLVVFLQKIGLLQSRKHHGWHHQAPYECNYCILTNYLNPILQYFKFWVTVEFVLLKVFKLKILRGTKDRENV